jgi:hypothetical protein
MPLFYIHQRRQPPGDALCSGTQPCRLQCFQRPWLSARGPPCAAFLYAIEGLGQGSLGTNWGDGLATNRQVLQFSGASDPNPFFQALLKAPYRFVSRVRTSATTAIPPRAATCTDSQCGGNTVLVSALQWQRQRCSPDPVGMY